MNPATAGRSRRIVPIAVRLGLAVVVAAGAFVVTRAVRSDDSAGPAQTDPPQGVTAELLPLLDIEVPEVAIPVVAPIAQGDDQTLGVDELATIDPEERATLEAAGARLQTDVTEIVSPIVGEATVPVDGVSAQDGGGPDPSTMPPPVLATALDLPVGEGGGDTDRPPFTEDVDPIEVDIDLDTLPEIITSLGGGPGLTVPGGAAERPVAPTFDGDPSGGADADPVLSRRTGTPLEPNGGLGFADPCADIEGDTGDFCPDGGEPGTITESFALTTPPLFYLDYRPRDPACAREVASDEVWIAVTSATPIDELELVYTGPEGSNSQSVLLTTPPATTEQWLREFEAAVTEPPGRILHCTTLTNLLRGARHTVRARGTDVFGQEAWFGYSVRFDGPDVVRPQTLVLPITDNEVMVSAAHRPDRQVRIWAFRRNGEPMDAPIDPCRGTADQVTGFDRAVRPERPMTERLDGTPLRNRRSLLARAGLDPEYNHRTAGALRLAEGSTYRLCVYRFVTAPSFEAGVESVEAFDLETPDAYDVSFSVLDVEPDDGVTVPAGAIEVSVRSARRSAFTMAGWCGRWTNPAEITERERVRADVCTVLADRSDLFTGGRVTLRTRNGEGDEFTSTSLIRLPRCDGSCADRPSDLYRLELPDGGPAQPPLCGVFLSACPLGSFGTIVLRVGYGNGNANGRDAWAISDPTELGDQRPDDVPSTPRLDTTQRAAVSGPGISQTLTVPVVADRPVTASLRVVDTFGNTPCTNGGSPTSSTGDVPSERHDFVLDGLCPDQGLLAIVELTDEAGATSRWHGGPGIGDDMPAELWTGGYVRTARIGWGAIGTLQIDVPTFRFGLRRFDVRINGAPMTWLREDGSLLLSRAQGCVVGQGQPINAEMRPAGTFSDSIVVIEADLDLEVAERPCGDSPPGAPDVDPIAIRAEFQATDIVLDEPITFVRTLPIPGVDEAGAPLGDATVQLTIVFRSRS